MGLGVLFVTLHQFAQPSHLIPRNVDGFVHQDPSHCLPAARIRRGSLVGNERRGVGHNLFQIQVVDWVRLTLKYYLKNNDKI